MRATCKLLSVLLGYPTEDLVDAAPDLRRALVEDGAVARRLRSDLMALIDDLAGGDLFDRQERYVLLFDRTRTLSLHIFEHVHGESRDRGQAMVDLAELYAQHGLAIDAKELPDYLPLFLEFLSTLSPDHARDLLGEIAHVIEAMRQRHRKRRSVYAIVFEVLADLAGQATGATEMTDLSAESDDDPNDLQALDKAWEEEAVTFGPGSAGTVAPGGSCPAARSVLARMDEPPQTDAA